MKIGHVTIEDRAHLSLVTRIEAVLDLLRKQGNKICAVTIVAPHDSPDPDCDDVYLGAIFYESDE